MSRLRAAVIGCGHFGRYHADKYAAAPEVELVGVVDADRRAAEAVAAAVGCAAAGELAELADRVDVASVVVPTHAHLEVARACLEAGLHVLVEKPVAATAVEARAMIDAAAAAGRILQVGHLERFNPAITALGDVIDRPMFVESTRIAPFKPRGTDVDVILDLMIHDIDLIQHLIDAPLASVDAIGVPVLSRRDDIANARLHFVGGCVVNVTASRVSLKSERKMRLFQREAYISIDFQARHATIARRGEGEMFPGVPDVRIEQRRFEAHDALALEIEAFLAAVRGERPVAVTGEDGLRALQTAEAITSAMLRPV